MANDCPTKDDKERRLINEVKTGTSLAVEGEHLLGQVVEVGVIERLLGCDSFAGVRLQHFLSEVRITSSRSRPSLSSRGTTLLSGSPS